MWRVLHSIMLEFLYLDSKMLEFWWVLDCQMLEFWFYTNSGSGLMLHNFDCLVASFQSSIGQKFECGLSRVEK